MMVIYKLMNRRLINGDQNFNHHNRNKNNGPIKWLQTLLVLTWVVLKFSKGNKQKNVHCAHSPPEYQFQVIKTIIISVPCFRKYFSIWLSQTLVYAIACDSVNRALTLVSLYFWNITINYSWFNLYLYWRIEYPSLLHTLFKECSVSSKI